MRRREPAAAGVVPARDARGRMTDGEPRTVATDESDGIGPGERAEEGGLARGERSIRQVVRGKESAGVHDRRLAVETAARQRADVRGQRPGLQCRGGRAAGDRVAARRREVGQTEDVQRFRIGLAQEQARLVEDVDDAQEAPFGQRRLRHGHTGAIAARPDPHLHATFDLHGDAPAVADRHGDRVGGDEPAVLDDQAVVASEAHAEQRTEGGAADERCLITRHAVAVAEDEGRAARADRHLGGRRGREAAIGPAEDPPHGRAAGVVERFERERREQLVGPVAVEIDDVHRVGDAGGIGNAVEVQRSAGKHDVVEEEAALARIPRLGEVRLAQQGDALRAIGAADEQPHRPARVRELRLSGHPVHGHRRRGGERPTVGPLAPRLDPQGFLFLADEPHDLRRTVGVEVRGHRLERRRVTGQDDRPWLLRQAGDAKRAARRQGSAAGDERGK